MRITVKRTTFYGIYFYKLGGKFAKANLAKVIGAKFSSCKNLFL